VGVLVGGGEEIAAVLAANPYVGRAANLVQVTFLNEATPVDALAGVSGRADEEITPGRRELTSSTRRVRDRPS
jgi:uncharacterized protein (DUF1697 family)